MSNDIQGNLNVSIDQLDKKLKPTVKNIKNAETNEKTNNYEISFVPENDSPCKIDIEYVDTLENVITGNTFNVKVKAIDFLVKPYPIEPLPINIKSMFTSRALRFLSG